MQIVLTPELEALVQQQLDTGRYDSAIDVITQAINLLQQQDNLSQEQLASLRHEAQLGWEAADRGELVDGPTAIAQIRAAYRRKIDEAYRTTEPPVDGHTFVNQLRQRISEHNT
jgi:antitoxin ParD1/3/4